MKRHPQLEKNTTAIRENVLERSMCLVPTNLHINGAALWVLVPVLGELLVLSVRVGWVMRR